MSVWQISQVRRVAAAVTMAGALTFTLSACGGDEKDPDKSTADKSAGAADSQSSGSHQKAKQPDDSEVIATLTGTDGIVLDITSATRDSGGFVTVNGNLKNTSGEDYAKTDFWTGPELAMQQGVGGGSMGGATMVDKAGKKRYYTLRDTENRPLATMGIAVVEAKSEQKVFMQFPAPPKSTAEVNLQIPTFSSANLKLTEA